MFTKAELERASQIISTIAKEHGVPETQVRTEMREAMDAGRKDQTPSVQAQWATIEFAGSESTVEEFILWVAEQAARKI